MHPDTERLIALHKTDVQIEHITKQIRGLKEDVEQSAQKIQEAQQRENEEREALLKLQETEEASTERYERYLKKAQNTKRLIETGQVSNFEAAEAQLKQCLSIADEEETALLQLMDDIEKAEAQIASRQRQIALREDQHRSKKEALTIHEPGLLTALAQAKATRENQASDLREDHLSFYEQLRKKLRHAVVTISSDACNSCGMTISSMPLAEHKRGSAVHRCRNCGRFLGELI